MKILPVQQNTKTFSFASKVFGYDDTSSQVKRNGIREHLEKGIFVYDEINNSGRLSEYELGQLIKSMRLSEFKPEKKSEDEDDSVDEELLDSAGFSNLRSLRGDNSYAASLGDVEPEQIQTAKRAGIKQVVYLDLFENMDAFKDIDCLFFRLEDALRNISCTSSEETYIKNELQKDLLYEIDYSEDKIPEYIKRHKQTYQKEKEKFNKNFVEFIQTMQKGNVLIGCDLGINRTNRALCLNFFFNPKAKITHRGHDRYFGYKMVNIYKNLSDEDKKAMGWDEEFDKNFIKRLEECGYEVEL